MTAQSMDVCFDEARIDSIFAPLDRCHFPGAAVGIAHNGKAIYRKGFGLANIESPLVMNPWTRNRIFSISKQFTCLAFLLLCERGRADIGDSIAKHIPELNPVFGQATVHQVMGHVSGVRDIHNIRYHFSGIERLVSVADMLRMYASVDDADFHPADAFCYNNGAYMLLSLAIERISDRSFDEVLKDNLFEPLGMVDTALRRFDREFVQNSAAMHRRAPSGTFDRCYLSKEHLGEGGVISTVDDLLRWLAHMNAPTVGSPAAWELMKRPLTLNNGHATDYALGIMRTCYRGTEILHHGGGGLGANAQVLKVPAANLDIVVLVNRDDFSAAALTSEVVDACLPDLHSGPMRSKKPPFIGTFRSPRSGRVVQLAEIEGRPVISIDGYDSPYDIVDAELLLPSGAQAMPGRPSVILHDAGQSSEIELSEYGQVDSLKMLQPEPTRDAGDLLGYYRSATADTLAEISSEGNEVYLFAQGAVGSVKYHLEQIAAGVWRARSREVGFLHGILLFTDDRSLFYFSNRQTSRLPFHRIESSDAAGLQRTR